MVKMELYDLETKTSNDPPVGQLKIIFDTLGVRDLEGTAYAFLSHSGKPQTRSIGYQVGSDVVQTIAGNEVSNMFRGGYKFLCDSYRRKNGIYGTNTIRGVTFTLNRSRYAWVSKILRKNGKLV